MLVYGRNVAKEVLNNNKKVYKVTIKEDFDDKNIISLLEKKNISYEVMNKRDFSRFDKYSNQGIIMDIEDFKYSELEDFVERIYGAIWTDSDLKFVASVNVYTEECVLGLE